MDKLTIINRQDTLICNLKHFIDCLDEKCNVIQSDAISKIDKLHKLQSINAKLDKFNSKIESVDKELNVLTNEIDTANNKDHLIIKLPNIEYIDSNSDSDTDSENLIFVSEPGSMSNFDSGSDSEYISEVDDSKNFDTIDNESANENDNENTDQIKDISNISNNTTDIDANDNFRFNMDDMSDDNSLEIIDSISFSNSNLNSNSVSISIASSIPSPTKLSSDNITTLNDNTKVNDMNSDIEILDDLVEINNITNTSTQTTSFQKNLHKLNNNNLSQNIINKKHINNNDKSWTLIEEDVLELDPIINDGQVQSTSMKNINYSTNITSNNNNSNSINSNSNNNNPARPVQIEPIYNWTKELYFHLINSFHLNNFRSNQLKAINSTLSGKDVFVLMPTGGGKSLCYQLPAIIKSGITHGTTIVISPLISLMQDQVENLLSLNIKACMFNSKLSQEQKSTIQRIFKNGDLNLIYISPEMISTSKTCQNIIESLYRIGRLSRIVIDEAHCVSNWGHDFRPDYKKLSFFKLKYPNIPMIALTATANNHVQNDIISNLKLRNPVILKQSFNRDNLFYQVLPKDKHTLPILLHCINTIFKNQTGIIYCHSKSSCEKLAKLLQDAKISCAFYHAGMGTNQRLIIQRKWQNDQIKIIIATIAFGMGIDKSNVRFVFHYTVPRTLENYYQETGRAGRDGNFSYCITFYSITDIRKLQKMIQRDKNLDKVNKLRHLEKLQEVMTYCDEKLDCRRKLVLQYFSENFFIKNCHNNCDNCFKQSLIDNTDKNSREGSVENNIEEIEKDITLIAKNIVQLVIAVQDERVTTSYCQDIFKGSNIAKILEMNHHLLPEHGYGKELNKGDIEKIFFYLITLRILQEYSVTNKMGFATNYIKVGPNVRKLNKPDYIIKLKFFKQIRKKQTNNNNSNSNNKNDNPLDNLQFVKAFQQRNLTKKERPDSKDNNTVKTVDNFDTAQISSFRTDPNELQENERIIEEIKQHHLFSVTEATIRKRKSIASSDKPKRKFKRRRRKYSKPTTKSYKKKYP